MCEWVPIAIFIAIAITLCLIIVVIVLNLWNLILCEWNAQLHTEGGKKEIFFFKKSFFVWMEIPITIDHSHNPLILIFAWIECSILFLAETNERICFLNVSPDEVIRSLFYNKNNDSLITVSVYASENFSSLKCRSTGIECVHSVAVHSNLPLWLIFTTYFAYVFIHFCS